jgi:hypothetical protein
MWRLLFLSSISGGLLATGCNGDDECGPGSAPASGLTASSADVSLVYGGLSSGANNDCPDPDIPIGEIVSVTIEGSQQDTGSLVVFCLPRPDKLANETLQLGTGLRIIDFNGEKDGCTYAFEASRPVTGTVSSSGICDNAEDPAGWALTIDGNISLRRTCPAATDTIAVSLTGTVAVTAK